MRVLTVPGYTGSSDDHWPPSAGHLVTADGYGRWPRIAELIEDAAAGRLWAAPLRPEQ